MYTPRTIAFERDGTHRCTGRKCPCQEPLRAHPYRARPVCTVAPMVPVLQNPVVVIDLVTQHVAEHVVEQHPDAIIDLVTQDIADPAEEDVLPLPGSQEAEGSATQDPFGGPESPAVIPGTPGQDPDYNPADDTDDEPASPASSGSETPDELPYEPENVIILDPGQVAEEAEEADAIAQVAAFEAAEEAAFMEAAIARIEAVEALNALLNNPDELPQLAIQDLEDAMGIYRG